MKTDLLNNVCTLIGLNHGLMAVRRILGVFLALGLVWGQPVRAASQKGKAQPPASAPVTFAPLSDDHELAGIWNHPEFTARLLGSYGFEPAVEPRMTPEEQASYRDKVVPALREDPEKAMATLKDMVKPGASAVFDFTLGNLYFQQGDFTNAVKHFEVALGKFPNFRRAQQNLAFALVRDGKYTEAIKPLTRAIALGGGDGKIYGLLGFAYLNQNRFASAEAAYRQALVFEPENSDLQLGVVKCAIGSANYDYALALLGELLQRHPERDHLWTLQANLHIQKGEPAEAALSLEMLRRLGQATAQSLYLLGDLYMTQEARDLALGAYLEAVDKDGGQNLTKALRPAQILVSRGAWEEARQLIARVRQAGPLSSGEELKVLKLEARLALATGRGEEGIDTLEKILQHDPLDAEALLMAGDYYARNGQPEKAEFRYQTAARIEGFEAEALVKQAQLLVQSRKYAQAAELLRRAQKTKPRDHVQRYLEKVEQLALTGRS